MPNVISESEKTPTRIRSASRAIRLLTLAARSSEGLGPSEAARALGVAVPTAYHLLATLCDEGVLARDARRRFVLGPRVGVLVDGFLRDGAPPEYLLAPLRQLAAETAETAYLTAWRGTEIHVLASLEGANAVRVAGAECGPYRFPHARATGKLLLAFTHAGSRRALLDGPLEALTAHTIVDRARLELELAEIRERGWAEDHEEFAEGVACLSVPMLLDGVAVAAYTLSAPVARFARDHERLLAAARRAAAAAADPAPHHESLETP